MRPPEFQIFGTPHLIVMGLTLTVPILLAEAARRTNSKRVADAGAYLLAGTLLINESIHWGYRLNAVGWSRFVQDHLPLHVCGLTIVLTAASTDLPPTEDLRDRLFLGPGRFHQRRHHPRETWKRDSRTTAFSNISSPIPASWRESCTPPWP